MRAILAFGILSVAILSAGCAEPTVTKPGLHPQSLERTVTQKTNYLLYLPKDYAETNKQWPLILFLHGSGERGNDPTLINTCGLTKHLVKGMELPFIIVAPQCPKDRRWIDQTDVLINLLDDIIERYPVDQSRVYLTGLSMGGQGTWKLATDYPHRFAAIVPICGRGDTVLARHRLTKMPVWVFHGAKDKLVPISKSEEMVEALRQAGNKNVKFTAYPNANHDSWNRTYTNRQLYEWFLEHSLK